MCGIVGGVARSDVVPVLVEGLRRLEYRGYDSCGVAVLDAQQKLTRVRSVARVAELRAQAAELAQDSNFTVSAHASACQTYLGFNGTKAPFNDPRVRRAVSLAVDRDTIVNEILSGYVAPAKGIVSQFNTPFFNTAPEAAATYDFDQAVSLAQEALGGHAQRMAGAGPDLEGQGGRGLFHRAQYHWKRGRRCPPTETALSPSRRRRA